MFVFVSITGMTNFAGANASDIKIGVLANRGTEHCMEEWMPTADYLTQMIQGTTFVIVPLDFEQIYDVVKKADIDFILASPAFYVELEALYKVNRIATLKNKVFNKAYTEYGSVVFAKKNRDDIQEYKDLKGKTFMAVHKNSLGGWLMAWREFKQAGIDPFKDFASLNFGQTHDEVVYAVRDGQVDAGNVRTDTLERMQAEDKIQVSDFKAIHEHGGEKVHLPFVHSTRSYPERPLAKLLHTSIGLAEMVVEALLAMPRDSAAAQAAKIAGWTIPLNYQDVHVCLKELKVGPYKDIGEITAQATFKKYWILILIDIVTLMVLAGFLFTIARLNQKVRTANKELKIEVDERIQAEAALRQSEHQFSTHLQNTSIGAISWDIDFKTIGWNPAAEVIFGYTKEEALGRHGSELIFPKDMKKLVDGIFQDILCFRGGTHSINENITKDDRCIICDWYNTSIKDIDGKVTGVTSLVNDITELKKDEESLRESEEKYRSILGSMDDVAYICSSKYVLEYLNPAMVKWIGHDATGKLCYQAIFGRDEKCTVCFHEKVTQGKVIKTEVISTKDNKPYHCSFSPISNKGGSVSILAIYRDIGELKKMEAQLQQAQKMESVGRLAGGVAHDFNNALSVIIGFADMALDDTDPKGQLHEDLNEIHMAANRAADITRQLLAFARKQTIDPKILDLNECVESMFKMLRRLIGEDIDLTWQPGANLWSIKMDSTQIDQILANLCVNAKDAIEGVGKVTIESGNVSLAEDYCFSHKGFVPGEFVQLSVSDNGCGMNKEVLNNIFEPFFTTKNVDKGTGLGLATVYGIVKQNNGFINVYSEPDKGTTIKIYLPQHEGKSVEIHERSTEEIPQGHGETVLVVEDDLSILKFMQKVLKGLGYSVMTSSTPEKVMDMVKEQTSDIHLLITDVIMPKMNGRELAIQLQSNCPDLKCIFMSGYTADAIVNQEILDKEVNFIQKPFSRINLAKIVRKVLDEN